MQVLELVDLERHLQVIQMVVELKVVQVQLRVYCQPVE
jgi:hypothetical protein